MLVSVTEIQNYERCKRRWDLTSFTRQGLTPLWPSTALHLGTLIHRVGALWLEDPSTTTPLKQIFYDEAAQDYIVLQRIFKDAGQPPPSQLQDSDYWEMVTLGSAMCENYQNYYKKPLPHGFKLVMPEQQITIPIPGTEHWFCSKLDEKRFCACYTDENSSSCCDIESPSCDSREPNHLGSIPCEMCSTVESHYIAGQLDAIIEDPTGRLFVFERKTYAARPNLRYLERDFQFLCYIWILQQTGALHGGIAYDGWWKRMTVPKGKTEHDLFFRHFMMRPQEEVDELEQYIAETVLEMASQPKTDPEKYISLRKTVPPVKGCIDCMGLIDLCDAISLNETLPMHKFVTRELTPAFVEFYKNTQTGAVED